MLEVTDPVIVLGKALAQSLRMSGLSYEEYASLAQQAGIEQYRFDEMYV